MALRDLAQFLEDDGLEYPLPAASFEDTTRFPNGKTYRVTSPSAKTGLWLTAMADLGLKVKAGADVTPEDVAQLHLDDEGEKSLYQRVLGATYDEMLADGLKWTVLQRIGQDAYLCFAMSPDAANAVLAGQGEAVARANRAARRAATKKAGRKSSQASTATATRTRRPASTGSSTPANGSGPRQAAV